MPGRLLLQADSGDGISIFVPAGRHISTVFLMIRKMKSDKSTISQSTDSDGEKAFVLYCRSDLGSSRSDHLSQRNRCVPASAIRRSLVAVADYRQRPVRFLSDVRQDSEQILREDSLATCQGGDMADISCSWMDPDCFHDGSWNRT